MVITLSGADLIGEVSYGENRAVRSPAGPGDWRRLDSCLCQFDSMYVCMYIYIYKLYLYNMCTYKQDMTVPETNQNKSGFFIFVYW